MAVWKCIVLTISLCALLHCVTSIETQVRYTGPGSFDCADRKQQPSLVSLDPAKPVLSTLQGSTVKEYQPASVHTQGTIPGFAAQEPASKGPGYIETTPLVDVHTVTASKGPGYIETTPRVDVHTVTARANEEATVHIDSLSKITRPPRRDIFTTTETIGSYQTRIVRQTSTGTSLIDMLIGTKSTTEENIGRKTIIVPALTTQLRDIPALTTDLRIRPPEETTVKSQSTSIHTDTTDSSPNAVTPDYEHSRSTRPKMTEKQQDTAKYHTSDSARNAIASKSSKLLYQTTAGFRAEKLFSTSNIRTGTHITSTGIPAFPQNTLSTRHAQLPLGIDSTVVSTGFTSEYNNIMEHFFTPATDKSRAGTGTTGIIGAPESMNISLTDDKSDNNSQIKNIYTSNLSDKDSVNRSLPTTQIVNDITRASNPEAIDQSEDICPINATLPPDKGNIETPHLRTTIPISTLSYWQTYNLTSGSKVPSDPEERREYFRNIIEKIKNASSEFDTHLPAVSKTDVTDVTYTTKLSHTVNMQNRNVGEKSNTNIGTTSAFSETPLFSFARNIKIPMDPKERREYFRRIQRNRLSNPHERNIFRLAKTGQIPEDPFLRELFFNAYFGINR